MDYLFASFFIIPGLLLCFFGYRLFKLSLAIAGFILGFGLGELGYLIFQPSGHGSFWYYFCAIFTGIVLACLSFSIYRLGILLLALSVTASVFASVHYILFANTQITFAYALILLVVGLFGGFAALKFQRPLVILYTALGGSFLMAKAFPVICNENFFFTINQTAAAGIALVFALLGFIVQMRAVQKKRRKRKTG